MATVHHPNLCPVYDVGVINDVHYMSMAYIEGRPLTDYVKSDTEIQARQVAAVVRKIAIALNEAHKAGIIHRDLKPDNIMINTRKEPVIMDFGLARRESANEAGLTKTGQIMGTPSYMAPEQVEGNNDLIGPRTDVFALGVIMYQMRCGELPFKGVVTLVLAKIISETPPTPSEIKADVDTELERICLKAKERDPEKRYQSADEVAQDLRRYLSGSSSGDTMRRAKKSPEAAQDISQTDQLANEYFESPSYSYTDEFAPEAWRRVKRTSRGRKTSRKKRRRRKSSSIDPLWLKIGGACLRCVIGTVLFFAFTGDDGTPSRPDSPDDSSGNSVAASNSGSGRTGNSKPASGTVGQVVTEGNEAGDVLKFPGDQATDGETDLANLVGHYGRQPQENGWHYVDIQKDAKGNLIWKNAAGFRWSLPVKDNQVWSGPDCKYGRHKLEIDCNKTGEVSSILFTEQVWLRKKN